jgi:hypothetical protein
MYGSYEVPKMLDHKSIKSTQIYAKASQKKVANNMSALTEKLFYHRELRKETGAKGKKGTAPANRRSLISSIVTNQS